MPSDTDDNTPAINSEPAPDFTSTSRPVLPSSLCSPTLLVPSATTKSDVSSTDSDDSLLTACVPTINQSSRNEWTCRLPRELMSITLEILEHDEQAPSLANLQSTSLAMYTIVTPYLSRHLKLNEKQCLKLFGQFNSIPRVDNQLFLQPVPTNLHAVDQHICHRLRANFSFVNSFHLIMGECSREGLESYEKLVTALTTLGAPTLWPSLKRLTLDMAKVKPYYERYIGWLHIPTAVLGEFRLGSTVVKHLSVKLPDETGFTESSTSWSNLVSDIHTEHLDVAGYTCYVRLMPVVIESVTFRFSLLCPQQSYLPHDSRSHLQEVTRQIGTADLVKVFNYMLKDSESSAEDPWTYVPAADLASIGDLRCERSKAGDRRDLRIGIGYVGQTEPELSWRTWEAEPI